MKALGIALAWIGVLCVLFSAHPLIGMGATCISLHVLWRWKKERDFVRQTLAPGAGLTYQPPRRKGEDRESARRRALGYDA